MSPKKIMNYQSSNTGTNSSLHAYLIICKQVKMKCSGWNKGEFGGPKLLSKHFFKKLSLNLSPNTHIQLLLFIVGLVKEVKQFPLLGMTTQPRHLVQA